MISVVICSRKTAIDVSLSDNISQTIGIDFEWIIIDNSGNAYSIFEAYNLGIEKSAGEIIVFMHDDIFIHTNEWGKIVKRIFDEIPNVGLLGIAGAKFKTKMPSGWWNCHDEYKEIHILQHTEKKNEQWNYGFKNGNLSQVAAIDGVFMAMKKLPGFIFDTNLKGFHNYDLAISARCQQKKLKIFATNEVLISHFSMGSVNKAWYESSFEFYKMYKKSLPLLAEDFNAPEVLEKTEFDNGSRFALKLLDFGLRREAMTIWMDLLILKPFSRFHLRFIKHALMSVTEKK